MDRKTRIATLLVLVAAASLAPAALGCSGSEEAPAQEVAASEDAIVEEHEGGSVEWSVSGEGKVKARVSGPDGKVLREKISGTLAWKVDAKAEAKAIPLALDAQAGLLVAAGPKLEAALTEVGYTLTVDGKPWSGTLHLPAGGTAELVASGKASAEGSAAVEGKLGPHGGVIQVVGEDRLEIVADEVTGEVRVYLLDADLKVTAVGKRKVTLAVIADAPEIVVLVTHASGLYLHGKWNVKVNPVRITVAVDVGGKVHVAVVGHKVGAKFALHAKAPRLKVRVKSAFDADADADVHAKADGKAKVKVSGPDVDVKAKAKAPDVKVKVKEKANGKGKASASVSVKIK